MPPDLLVAVLIVVASALALVLVFLLLRRRRAPAAQHVLACMIPALLAASVAIAVTPWAWVPCGLSALTVLVAMVRIRRAQ